MIVDNKNPYKKFISCFDSMRLYFFLIFILSLSTRLFFIIAFPETGGDFDVYSIVAKNILRGCGVSLSDPLSTQCVAHFGGNHGPGYDAFIALVWFFFNESNFAIRIIQSLIYCSFVIYLLIALKQFINRKGFIIIFGIVFSISPLLIAWPRYLQTETLAIAFTIFTISEILFSLKEKKVRVFSIALALTLATWIRLDNIFLTIPVAFCCLYIHGIKKGILHGISIAFLLSLSWGIWTIRNVYVKLPSLIPQNMIMPDGSRPPSGYLSWAKTWITHEYEKPGSLWGINRKNYLNITIPDYAYYSEDEKIKVNDLLTDLKKLDQMPFPKSIDDEFKLLAKLKKENFPFKYWVENPLKRIYTMWSNPFSSFGWPNEIPSDGLSHSERLNVAKGNLNLLVYKVKKYPYRTMSKAVNAFYKFSLIILFLYSLFYIFIKSRSKVFYFFGLISLSYLLGRTIFFSLNGIFETRYLVTIIPFMEILVAFFIYDIFKKKFKNPPNSNNL